MSAASKACERGEKESQKREGEGGIKGGEERRGGKKRGGDKKKKKKKTWSTMAVSRVKSSSACPLSS